MKPSQPLSAARLVAVLTTGGVVLAGLIALLPWFGAYTDDAGRHFGFLSSDALDSTSVDYAILQIRLSRVLACALVGAALGLAGASLQAVLRNPLAEPFTLGVSSGASLAAVIAIRFGVIGAFGIWGTTVFSLLGAVVVMLLVWRLAVSNRSLPAETLVLAGVTVSMFCSAASVLIQATAEFSEVGKILKWMMGGFDVLPLRTIAIFAAAVVACTLVILRNANSLNALQLGEDSAASLGVEVGKVQSSTFLLASLLVGISIAIAGPIGFVGLIVPHVVRAMVGADHRLLLPAAAIGGAIVLLICDTVARTIVVPHQLPPSAVTAVFGGPFFVMILLRYKHRGGLGGHR